MPNQGVPAAAVRPPGALARPDWRAGGEFRAADLRLEQQYFLQRLRRHLRLVHGWGVVCGLNVVASNEGDGWELFVCPGYGIGPCGDEIFVPERIRFNLRDYLWTRPVAATTNRVWIAIEAREDALGYAFAPEVACGCSCLDSREEVSRLADDVRVVVSWTSPISSGGGFDVCSGATPPCPLCPESCGLLLATVVLPPSTEPILRNAIDNLEEDR
jgi:hypothetical protein